MHILIDILCKEETSIAYKHWLTLCQSWRLGGRPASMAFCWTIIDKEYAYQHNEEFIRYHFKKDDGVSWIAISFPKENFYLTVFPDGSRLWFNKHFGWKYSNFYRTIS